MEAYAFLYLIVFVAWLIIQYAVAGVFYSIACMKGHEEKKYFWWCFFLSIAGYLMVVALPDRAKEKKSGNWIEKMKQLEESESASRIDYGDGGAADDSPEEGKKDDRGGVKVAEEDGKIKCPACGTVQNSDRKLCWMCGVKFEE